jgi:hypothetical protein
MACGWLSVVPKLTDMGLDAYVPCRCWQDGVTSAPPVPRDLIVADEDLWLGLSVPYEGNERLHHEFDRWVVEQACAHRRMHLASVRVANWASYRLFQQALATAGWERFPTLHGYLPDVNGGSLPAASAASALAELRQFGAEERLGTWTHLIDEQTGARLAFGVPAYEGVFIMDGRAGKDVGADEGGLFIRDRNQTPPPEEFRSPRFSQEVIGDTPDGRCRVLRLTDAATSKQFVVPLTRPIGAAASGSDRGSYPRQLRVESTGVTGADFDYIVEPLTTVLRAAESAGNPVVWF